MPNACLVVFFIFHMYVFHILINYDTKMHSNAFLCCNSLKYRNHFKVVTESEK